MGYFSKSVDSLVLLMVAIQIGLGNSPFWRAVLVRFSVERSPLVIRRREAARFEALQAKSSARHPDRPPSGRYSMPTQVLLDSHHGVTRYDRATPYRVIGGHRVFRTSPGGGFGKLFRNPLPFRFQQEVTQPCRKRRFPEPRSPGIQHQAESEASNKMLAATQEIAAANRCPAPPRMRRTKGAKAIQRR